MKNIKGGEIVLNQFIAVGRIVEILDNCVIVSIPRPYKNDEGNYDSDIIRFVLKGTILENTKQYCKKGDILGIKGRIQNENEAIELVAEKVTFLSSKSK